MSEVNESGLPRFVTLNLDDEDVECMVLTTLTMNDMEYIALTPVEERDEEEDDVWFYRFKRDLHGEDHEIDNIEDDDEYEAIGEVFDEWLDNMDFDDTDEE